MIKMKEYTIDINFTVDARDYDEAVEIAKATREIIKHETNYKLRDVETHRIEEL